MQEASDIVRSGGGEPRRLILDSGLGSVDFARAKLYTLLGERGFLCAPGGGAEAWNFEEFLDDGGTMVYAGPAFAGRPLRRLLHEGPGAAAWTAARAYALALAAVEATFGAEEAAAAAASGPAGAVISEDGAVLLLPPKPVIRALDARGPEASLEGVSRWASPDLSGSDAAAFAAATVLRSSLAGVPPFGAGDAETAQGDMRDGLFLPSRLAVPGIDAGLAAALDDCLGLPSERSRQKGPKDTGAAASRARADTDRRNSSLQALVSRIADGAAPPVEPLGEAELANLAEERNRIGRADKTKTERRRFLRRHRTALLISAGALVVAGFVARSLINDARQRFSTAGLSPLQVVETYYQALDGLDHETMSACVVDKAGSDDINLAMNLFVISRVRMAYEHVSAYRSASSWVDEGKPETKSSVFGVSNLDIRALGQDTSDGEVTFEADYIYWKPREAEDQGAPAQGGDTSPATEASNGGSGGSQPQGASGTDPATGVAAGDGNGGSRAAGHGAPATVPGDGQPPKASVPEGNVDGPGGGASGEEAAPPPEGRRTVDILGLVLRDGRWRIASIQRSQD